MECKSGYKDNLGQLKKFYDRFITEAQQYATQKPGYFFVAVFVCEYPFDGQMQYQFEDGNLSTMVKVVDEMNCPRISRFLKADLRSRAEVDALAEAVSMTIGDDETKPYPGGTPKK